MERFIPSRRRETGVLRFWESGGWEDLEAGDDELGQRDQTTRPIQARIRIVNNS